MITNSYNSAILRIDLDELFASENDPEALTGNPVSENPELLLWTRADADHGTLRVTMRANSQEQLDRVVQAVEDQVKETKQVLNRTIGEHTLSVLNSTTRQTVDFDYAALQQSFNDNIYELMQGLADSNDELSAMEKPQAPAVISVSIKKEAVKFGIIGVILGVILFVVIVVVLAISKESVMSLHEIKERYQIPVLGTYSGDQKKRGNKLDNWLARKLGVTTQERTAELDYIKAAKALYLEPDQILLVSTSDADRLDEIANAISDSKGTVYVAAGNLENSAVALTALQEAKSVICVERWKTITHEELRKELEMIQLAVPKDQIAMIITQ